MEGEGKRNRPSESEVNSIYRSYADTGGNVNEEIKLLNSISYVSARLARNLSLLAASQSEKGGKDNVKNVEQMMQSCFSSIVPLVTSVTVAVVVTALNDPRVLWLYLFAVPVAGITVGVFRQPIRKSNRRFRREMERTQAAVSEMLEMVPVTRAYGLSEEEADRMDALLGGDRKSVV